MNEGRSVWRGRTALVTGCTGFLGEAVTRELLQRGATVVAYLEKRFASPVLFQLNHGGQLRPVYGRIEDTCRLYSAIAIHEASVVFNLAEHTGMPPSASSHREDDRDDCGVAAVLRAAALRHSRLPVIAVRPTEHVRLMGAEPGGTTPHGIARFGELFGEGDGRLSRTVPRLLTALLSGERVPVNGDMQRDYVYVRDAARACLAVAEAIGQGETRVDAAFRSGWQFCEADVVKLLTSSLAGSDPQCMQAPVNNPFGWQPAFALAEALHRTIEWHRELATGSLNPSPPKHTLRKAA
jgi:nucleoside-diphosphate-sugar epimerase